MNPFIHIDGDDEFDSFGGMSCDEMGEGESPMKSTDRNQMAELI